MNDFFTFIGFIVIFVALVLFFGWIGCEIITYDKPTAIEVYQGKTTLKITYKDGIPVDSTVVYKNRR